MGRDAGHAPQHLNESRGLIFLEWHPEYGIHPDSPIVAIDHNVHAVSTCGSGVEFVITWVNFMGFDGIPEAILIDKGLCIG